LCVRFFLCLFSSFAGKIGRLAAITAVTPGSADFEQFTCANCGLTQFYATDLKALRRQ